jgi:antitoxin CcdA
MNERVTVELDAKALAAAREAGIDLSELLSHALQRRLPQLNPSEREQAARQWYEDNKDAVDAYNEMIEMHGLFSDGVRMF